MTTANIAHTHRINRLRYRGNHRGCKETDLVLGQYCEKHLEGLNDDELTLLETFFEEFDSDIWNWIVGKTPCPEQYNDLIKILRQHSPAK